MTSRYCFEALDRTLRDVLSCNDASKSSLPFGGKTVVLGGDFRQTLPVIEGGSRNEIIDASLIASPLWRHACQRAEFKREYAPQSTWFIMF
jgi:ATP-dependent DNA helicase PIF1